MIYFNDLNHQPKDAYIGQRQILVGSTESGKFNYYASDVINGTVTLKLKNTGAESMMIDYLMLQRISDDAPEAPTGLTVTQNANEASLAWEPIDGADYYNIYRNGRIIGVSTTVLLLELLVLDELEVVFSSLDVAITSCGLDSTVTITLTCPAPSIFDKTFSSLLSIICE